MRGQFGRFKVLSARQYRGHHPGTIFEAEIDPAINRALAGRRLELIELVEPALAPGSWRFPSNWPPEAADMQEQTGAPQGASLIQ